MGLTEAEKQALRYAGWMGHNVIVLNSKLRIRAELNHTNKQARDIADECGGAVYERTNSRFKKVYDGKKSKKEKGGEANSAEKTAGDGAGQKERRTAPDGGAGDNSL